MQLFRTAVAGLCLLASASAFAVDYDYERARRAWEDRDRQLDAADAELNRQEALLRPLQQRLDEAEDRVDTLTNQIRSLRDEQRDVEIELTNNRSSIDRLRTERESLLRNKSSAQADLRVAERELRDLNLDVERSLGLLAELDRRIQDLQNSDPDDPELPTLRRERDDLAGDIGRKQQNQAQLARRIGDLRSEIESIQANIDNVERNIANFDQRNRELDTRLSNIRFEISDKELSLSRARDAVAEARSQRDRQQSLVDQAQGARDVAFREERAAYNYYQQVLADYQSALNAAMARGRADALNHSEREASERGQPAGRTDGDRSGTDTGRQVGLVDSRGVSEAQGYNHGLSAGDSDASLAAAYARGRGDGASVAQAKARAEDFPRSYNLRLNEVFAAPPTAQESYDITNDLPTIPGSTGPRQDPEAKAIGRVDPPQFGAKSEPVARVPEPTTPSVSVPATDRRYYAPSCLGQPLPVFTQACSDAYAQNYGSGYSDAYRRHYQSSYASAFRPAASSAYASARQTQHPTVYAQAADAGAHDLGVLNGFTSNIAAAQARAVADGRAAVEALRGQGFIPLLRSVALTQDVDDDNLSPGEAVKVEVVIDNYGMKNAAHEKLQLKITDLANVTFSIVLRKLPAIAADTRVRLTGVLSGAAAQAAGRSAGLKAVLEELQADGSAITLDEASFQAGIRLPLELTQVDFTAPLQVGVVASSVLTLKNNTNGSIAGLQLPLSLTGEGLTTTVTGIDVPTLGGGETAAVNVQVTPTEFASTSVPIDFKLTAGSIAGSAPLVLSKQVGVPVVRTGHLELCMPTCGSVVTLPIRVRAGTTFALPSQFRFTGTRRASYEFGKLAVSDPRITSGNNSTVRVGPGEWGPGSQPYGVNFSYVVPAALRGQTHWVSLYLKQGATRIQTLKVPIVVE